MYCLSRFYIKSNKKHWCRFILWLHVFLLLFFIVNLSRYLFANNTQRSLKIPTFNLEPSILWELAYDGLIDAVFFICGRKICGNHRRFYCPHFAPRTTNGNNSPKRATSAFFVPTILLWTMNMHRLKSCIVTYSETSTAWIMFAAIRHQHCRQFW